MANSRRGIATLARRAKAQDVALRKKGKIFTGDSFVNFSQKMGVGADNPLTTATYGFNPITRMRTILEWAHRGNWIAGLAVDIPAEDMTRAGVEFLGVTEPEAIEKIEELAVSLHIWNKIKETIKWGRLYGGCIAYMMIDGQKPETPLRLETVGPGQFKGLLVLDRWMVDPSLSELITELGPDMGTPKFYTVIADAPAIPRMKIHHTRVIRTIGNDLPYWQRVMENLWGESVLERIWDRMIPFDSATMGAAQLVYKAYIRTYKIKDLKELTSQGGDALAGMVKYVEFMRRFQGNEGITLIDADDDLSAMAQPSFSGLADSLIHFGQQLSGALQIPLVRLFGQSPAGLNSTGESDLRMYYDGIKKAQVDTLQVAITRVYRALAQSAGVRLPPGFKLGFRSLWQLTEGQKAEIASSISTTVTAAEEAALISPQTALKELKQQSLVTGIFTNITPEEIEAAADIPVPKAEPGEGGDIGGGGSIPGAKADERREEKSISGDRKRRVQTKDSLQAVSRLMKEEGIQVSIENPKGSLRRGRNWETVMPYDYGYINGTIAPDGDGVDCMVGTAYDSRQVFIFDQVKLDTKKPDEPKVFFYYQSIEAAMKDFLMGYGDGRGWDRIGGVRQYDMTAFKASVLPEWKVK